MATNSPTAPGADADAAPADSNPTSEDRLARWEERSRPWIIASAVLPLFGAFTTGTPDVIVWLVAFGTWLVFLVDLVVHLRLAPGYLRTGAGIFDLGLVLLTFPYYLVIGNDVVGLTQVLRLARLGRVGKAATSSPVVKRFLQRLGRPVGYAVVVWIACSLIVVRAEGPDNGFTDLGTGLWWGIVTLTTVGYGDLVPQTTVGRLAASTLMLAGVALLGTVAASLASLFQTQDVTADAADDDEVGDVAGLRRQVDDLHVELRAIRELLVAQTAEQPAE